MIKFCSKNKKRNVIVIVITILIIIATIFIGLIIENNNNKKKIEEEAAEYKRNAYSFAINVLSSLASMETVGNDISSYWKDFIYNDKYDSIDDAVSKALEKNANVVFDIKAEKNSIDSAYKNLLTIPDIKNNELIEIKSIVKEYYDAYYDFYSIVVSPTGNYMTFVSKFNDADTNALKKYNNLLNLVG